MIKYYSFEKVVGDEYDPIRDEYNDITETIEIEATDYELSIALADLIYGEYFSKNKLSISRDYKNTITEGIIKFIKDKDLVEQLVEEYEDDLEDWFEEDLDDYF